jgi:hypothetical protein
MYVLIDVLNTEESETWMIQVVREQCIYVDRSCRVTKTPLQNPACCMPSSIKPSQVGDKDGILDISPHAKYLCTIFLCIKFQIFVTFSLYFFLCGSKIEQNIP